ncbi:scavenger mRNA decapping enzyme [Peptostreptococcaceae bacterium AS15]|nr:histidine triad domain protein [[Eubacterium] yurii subsp. margaretiae ATCC 43715]EJP20317.1 scavenger mRNA decapping enzyme [Peptostreptococcaceae bacterium AS15]
MDCIFCKIVNGEIPSKIVYEDDNVLAFNDIDPQAPVHIVVIPKKHFANILELNDSTILNAIFDSIRKIADEQKMEKGFRIVCNTGSDGGQTVDHLHFHILAGRNLQWPPG